MAVGIESEEVAKGLDGDDGAGVDTSNPTVDRALWHVFNAPGTYYFSVVDINGGQVKVTSYSGNTGVYDVFDSFTIVKNKNWFLGGLNIIID
jgi:xanthine dehydrogenase molybdopterin-binding subunit B